MTSLQTKADAVRAAAASTSTCTAATVVSLKELLALDLDPSISSAKSTKAAAIAKTSTRTAKSKTTSGINKTTCVQQEGLLSSRDRTALATHIINAAIKSLAEAAKTPPTAPETPSKRSHDASQTASKSGLRRSFSAPLSPLQPRTLNRVATSPMVTTKPPKPALASQSTGCLATVECARLAFACLRSLKGNAADGQNDFQLENGMLALIGKLMALKMYDQAFQELRTLKCRLEAIGPEQATSKPKTKTKTATKPAVAESPPDFADMMQFHCAFSKDNIGVIASYQIQLLKLIAATKKASHIEAVVHALCESHPSSPIHTLLTMFKNGGKDASAAARHMASLSQILFSLAPSVSSQEDTVAVEPRLSPSPKTSFLLQSLALKAQLTWWRLAKHQGDIDNDVISPLARCIRAFSRRQKPDDGFVYKAVASSFNEIMQIIRTDAHNPSEQDRSALAIVYQLLGSTAQAAREYKDACRWFGKFKDTLSEDEQSVRTCSVKARLLAAALKQTELDDNVEDLARQVTDGLDGSLSGTVGELNDLLESLSLARRSAVGILMKSLNNEGQKDKFNEDLTSLLKAFIRRYPRFIRRWMGTPPAKDAAPKQTLQFDQRRQLATQSFSQVLDATLTVIKLDIQTQKEAWVHIDDVLQHCVSLIDLICDPLSVSRAEHLNIYRVKISNLYFCQFSKSRKHSKRSKEDAKQLLQALSRSIDAVKDCSTAEKEKAELSMKRELFADLCKGAGRPEDAVATMRSICTEMVEAGVLSTVAQALATQSPVVAWASTEKTTALSRTLRSIAKLDKSWNDWTFFLPEAERAAVLEHLLPVGSEDGNSNAITPMRLHDLRVVSILRIYTLDKYPVRRLRVLLRLLCQNIGDQAGSDEFQELVDLAFEQVKKKDKSEDASLSDFIPHMQTFYTSILALLSKDDVPGSGQLREAVCCWRSMFAKCQTREDINAIVDDPDNLLRHLKSLNQLAGLRGENQLQVSISDLSISVTSIFKATSDEDLVIGHSQKAVQLVQHGLINDALKSIDLATSFADRCDSISNRASTELYLSQAEYYSCIGKSDDVLSFISKINEICRGSYSTWAQSKAQATIILAMTSLLHSTAAIQIGDVQQALSCIKTSVRMLSHDWSKLELEKSVSQSKSTVDMSTSDPIADCGDKLATKSARVAGPRLWVLASPLVRSLLHISSVYAYIGMFQETMYYADFAGKVADSAQSTTFKAQVKAWAGSIYLKAGQLDKAQVICNSAAQFLPMEKCALRVKFASQLSDICWEIGDNDKALEFLRIGEETASLLEGSPEALGGAEEAESDNVETKVPKLKASATSRSVRSTRRKTPARPLATKKTQASKPATAASPTPETRPSSNIYQSSLQVGVILSRAVGFIRQKDWTSALSILDQTKDLSKLFGTLSKEQVVMATALIGHSMDQMMLDPVFSVVQDSTISLPAVSSGTEKALSERASTKATPPRRGRGAAAERKASTERKLPAFADALKQAQDLLMEAHAYATSSADSNMVYRISTLLQNTMILLSASSSGASKMANHLGMSTVAVDVARNISWRREQRTLAADLPSLSPVEVHTDHLHASASRRSTLGLTTDMSKFQKNYVELVPESWSVISVSLSDNRHDLCLTKFQAGHSPFILRLPLERANSRDADSEVFNFEHGRQELLDIIKLANETSHSARDFKAKGERGAWWAEREALDDRLKELLATIEATWLGGFKGIFSQHRRRADLLARFQKSFHQILEGSLPSRSKMRGKKSSNAPTVTLDPRVLDLFIGLGDPSEPNCDYDEALNDLLYFVVDILQFHGERNAYDEIDFDAMVVETYDALRGYYDAAAKCGAEKEQDAHTVLVLDKALHAFPWESLSCMDGLSVSRVPSLACLRKLILEANTPVTRGASNIDEKQANLPDGHYVSAKNGTYILNPSSDLRNTQSFFQPSFSGLNSWTSIVNREPQESDFESALSKSDIMLYFGHGSGAQYIRGKTIRRLDKCRPATFLMGCSSAALTEVGGFENYGPVWNYMMAGCPAVVGTLWDVTDRDIDRFAGKTFEEWGLFAKGAFGEKPKSTSRGTGSGSDDEGHGEAHCELDFVEAGTSLPAAVAKARGACRFKYLNAAAVVVFGIPVYIQKGE